MNLVQRFFFKLGALIHDAESAWTRSTLRSCGSSVTIDRRVFIWGAQQLDMGNHVEINGYTAIYAAGGVRINDNVLIGANCVITSVSHAADAIDPHERHQVTFAPVELKDNCWLGAGSVVLPGVTIGKNSIVAAGSVVTKDIPDNCICAGAPAKIMRYLDSSN